jgi:hypothetical protein
MYGKWKDEYVYEGSRRSGMFTASNKQLLRKYGVISESSLR